MFKRNGMVKRLRSHSSSVKATGKAQARNHLQSPELRERIYVFWSRAASSKWRAVPCRSIWIPSEFPFAFASHDSRLRKRTLHHQRRVSERSRCPNRKARAEFSHFERSSLARKQLPMP